MVVVLAVLLHEDLRFQQASERLRVGVLPQVARLDIQHLNPGRCQPEFDSRRHELGAVVRTDVGWLSSFLEQACPGGATSSAVMFRSTLTVRYSLCTRPRPAPS